MFQSLIEQAKTTVTGTVSKVRDRAIIGALAAIAAGFGVAAVAAMLIDAFGAIAALLILAGVFAAAAVAMTSVASANERRHDAMAQAMASARPSLVSQAVTAAAPIALARGAGAVVRRTPAILIMLVLGGLYLSTLGKRSPSERP